MVGASGQGTWVTGSVAPVLASEYAHSFQHDRGTNGSLELHGKRGSQKDPKYPRRTLIGETLGS